MLHKLPPPLLGAVMILVLIFNTLFWAVPLYAAVIIKLFLPKGDLRDAVSRLCADMAQRWAVANTEFVRLLMRVEWDIRVQAELSPQAQYLACSNHQSWNDIFAVMHTFGRRAPFFKFFLKQELIWVPVLGLAWWGLDYPFMKRYSAEQVAKNPALKGKDIETTRKACEKFRNQPVLILNYLEGTRFTPAKHAAQQSPYRHLLKPKAGGFAFALSAMGDRLNALLDITVVYPEGAKGFWAFMSGRVRKIIVDVRQLTIPHEFFHGSYENDPEFRARFQDWIAQLWAEKDRRIGELLSSAA